MTSEINYYMIVNTGTLIQSQVCQRYPYHMVLAQQYIADETYRATLAKMQELDTCRIILDNGAHEGIDIDLDVYEAVIMELEPDCVVLPDLVSRPGSQSYDLSMAFAEWMWKHQGGTRLMFVAQGENKEDVLYQYHRAHRYLDPKDFMIGLGQAYLHWVKDPWTNQHEAARQAMILDMIRYGGLDLMQAHQYHILGGRWSPAHYGRIGSMINISGLDSVKPCTCAYAGTSYPVYPYNKGKIDLCDSTYAVSNDLLTLNIDRLTTSYGMRQINWALMYGTKSVW